MKAIFTFLLAGLICTLFAQEKYTDKNNETQIWGNITVEDLQNPPFDNWYWESLSAYEVSRYNEVAAELSGTEVLIYLGTWCSDSQDWVPKFIKLWQEYGLNLEQVKLVALHNADDKYKQSPEKTEAIYDIVSVPTFIIMRDGKEIGRIIEYPQSTLEDDLKNIMLGLN